MSDRRVAPALLRRCAELIVRGIDAPYVLGDLEEAWVRDRERGRSVAESALRYAVNAILSAVALNARRIRDGRLGASWLDVKLGLRMLRREPAVNAVSLLALAIGIPIAMMPGQLERAFDPDLPFDEGHRIVGIRTINVETSRSWTRSLHDFERWSQELGSVQLLGVWDGATYNVTTENGSAEAVEGAAMTASAFEIVRVPPLLGRTLQADDEEPGAPPVVVLGYGLWRSALAGDADAVGRTVQISGIPHEVVGVMPEGFLFPNLERFWIPFRERAIDHPAGSGPTIWVFGRLADGATRAEANEEVERLRQRWAAADPAEHAHLRSSVVSFTHVTGDVAFDTPEWLAMKALAGLLLVIACGNVGILILARTALRTSELAVRTALGASRVRIIVQIFVETLVIGLVAVSLGLLLADGIATVGHRAFATEIPFWLDFGVQPETVVVALLFAGASAGLAGVVPALKATGGHVHETLQHGGRGATSMRFGAFSSVLIVAEVAVAVLFLTFGTPLIPFALGNIEHGAGIDPDRYLAAQLWHPGTRPGLEMEPVDDSTFQRQIGELHAEVSRALAEESLVSGVAIGSTVPGGRHSGRWVEVEGMPASDGTPAHWVRTATVVPGFFEALDQPPVAGRGFDALDGLGADSSKAVVVNTRFVEEVMGGRNAIGRRIRTVDRGGGSPGPWWEVVGVVPRLGMFVADGRLDAGFYRPATPGLLNPIQLGIRVDGDPNDFGARLREVVAAVDPQLQVQTGGTIRQLIRQQRMDGRWALLLVGAISLVAIVLSAAGLYALVGFTVTRRRREIGIRTALGAQQRRIALGVARRAVLQLLAGVALGGGLAVVIVPGMASGPGMSHVRWYEAALTVSAIVFAIGLLACVPPIRRSLTITPMEALAEE